MYKKYILFFIACFLVSLLSGCVEMTNSRNDTELKIVGNTIIEVGKTESYSIAEHNIDEIIELEWISTNEDVALINNEGVLEAKSSGDTIIIVRDKIDIEINGRLLVKVISEKIEYTNDSPISIDIIGKKELLVNETALYEFITNPINSSQDVSWISSDENILSVNNNGVAVAKKAGNVILSCKSNINMNILGSIHILIKEQPKYDNYESQMIKVIDDAKDSIFGIGNYSLSKDYKYIFSSFGSGFVYKCFPVINDKIIKTYDEETINNAEKFYCYIATNRHVIESADKVTIYMHTIDEEVSASIIGYDIKEDVAVLGFYNDYYIKPLTIASSENLKTGQTVIAIGNPTDILYSTTATSGIISSPNRYTDSDTDGDGKNDWATLCIQHDAPINPGCSGGPLLDINGNVVGINTSKYASIYVDNMGFSISSEVFMNLFPYLENNEQIKRITLGISTVDVQDINSLGLSDEDNIYIIPDNCKKGIYVTNVSDNSLAEQSGFQKDDIIILINDVSATRKYTLRKILYEAVLNDQKQLVFTIIRNDEIIKINIEI